MKLKVKLELQSDDDILFIVLENSSKRYKISRRSSEPS
jgi:hypothetical protein